MVITRKNFGRLLDCSLQDSEASQPLLEPMASQELKVYQVGLTVSNPEKDTEEVVKPV